MRGNFAANARLIAAAPDLLKALQAIPQRYIDDMDAHTPMASKMIRAAIAKHLPHEPKQRALQNQQKEKP